jgi:excisionase family DNA binding protein
MSDLGRLLEQLDEADLERLAERLRPYLAGGHPTTAPATVYSPATLATALGRSERSIRAAISRGELHATKRGRGYVISADAVAAWAQAPRAELHYGVIKLPRPRSTPGPARRGLQS